MCIQVHILLDLQRHKGVDVLRQECQTVVRTHGLPIRKLIHRSAALEAKALEHLKGRFLRQTVDIHNTGLLDHMMRVIGLVDRHSDPVRCIGHLGHGIDNKTIILLTVIGSHYIQTIANVEQGSQIVLIGGFAVLCQIITAKLLCQLFHLRSAGFIQRGANGNHGVRKGDILAFGQHFAHDLTGLRCPGAIFHKANGTVAIVALCQMVNKLLHKGEQFCIVGCGGQHQLIVAEGILHSLCHILSGKVGDNHFGTALFSALFCQQFHCLLGVAVYRSIGDHDTLALRGIGRPCVIQIQIIAQILLQHRAMEGADHSNIQAGSLLQQGLHLCAILAHDADIVAPCLASPLFLYIQRAELTKTVCREQHFVLNIVCHDYFRPVYHGRRHKGQHMFAQRKGVPLLYNDTAIGIVRAEELLHHHKCLGRRYHHGICVQLKEVCNVGRVVGLHMLHHQIIRLSAIKHRFDIIQPLMGKVCIHRIHNGDFFIHDDIRVIRHTVGNHILSLKQVHIMIIDTNIADIFCNFHCVSPYDM